MCNLISKDNPPVFVDQAVDPIGCTDSDNRCALWATSGECQANAAWMMLNCKKSCQSCQGGEQNLDRLKQNQFNAFRSCFM